MPNKKRVIAIAQARMGSTRLPGKVLAPLGREGRPVLRWAYDAIKKAHGIDEVVIATSTLPQDDAIARYCAFNNINCFRGSESDVVKRFYECALAYGAEVVLRLTCDCPFLDPQVISEVVRLHAMKEVAYASNIDPPTYPDGLDVECFSFDTLFATHNEAVRGSDRDCVTQYILRNRDRFPAANLTASLPGLVNERWVLDTKEDYQFCAEVAHRLDVQTPNYMDILKVLDIMPELRDLNKGGVRNERFFETIYTEELPPRSFKRSQERLPLRAALFRLALRLSLRAICNSLRELAHFMLLMVMGLVFLIWTAMIMLIWSMLYCLLFSVTAILMWIGL